MKMRLPFLLEMNRPLPPPRRAWLTARIWLSLAGLGFSTLALAPRLQAQTITVDAQANRKAISPLIYGVAFASSNQLADLHSPINRSGGNSETRYNWQLNAHNHAADWYFESLADSPSTPGAAADTFVADSKNGGALPMPTVSMIGW